MSGTLISTPDGSVVKLGPLYTAGGKVIAGGQNGDGREKYPRSIAPRLHPTPSQFDDFVTRSPPDVSAMAEVAWSLPKDHPSTAKILELLKRSGGEFKDFGIRIHLRSFFARLGIDAAVHKIEYRKADKGENSAGSILANVELQFLVDTQRNGKLRFPLYDAMHEYKGTTNLSLGNLVFVPPDAKPLSENEFGELVRQGTIRIRQGWHVASGTMIRIPMGDTQYPVGVSRELLPQHWREVFTLGKRALVQRQAPYPRTENFLRSPFDVRGIHLSACDPEIQLLLARETSNPDVVQTASPFLDLPSEDSRANARHVELRTPPQAMILARSVFTQGEFYRSRRSVTVSGGFESAPQVISTSYAAQITLDGALVREPAVANLFALLNEEFEQGAQGIQGVVLSAKKAHLIPPDGVNGMTAWARVAALQDVPIDERPLNALGKERMRAILSHPGIAALQKTFRDRTSHHCIRLLISEVLPSPEQIRQLAVTDGSGIGVFIASKLKEVPQQGTPGAANTLGAGAIEEYHALASEGIASIYWAEPTGAVRKLIGPTFVELGLQEFYQNMDLVLTLYLSHLNGEKFVGPFKEEFSKFLLRLGALGLKIGIASGAAPKVMEHLIGMCGGVKGIYPIGISTLDHGQMPSLMPKIITISDGTDWRFRSRLLATIADVRLALNGGLQTTGEIAESGVDGRDGFVLPAPTGIIDVANTRNWAALSRHWDRVSTRSRTNVPLAPPWTRGLFADARALSVFFERDLIPYLRDPLAWMHRVGVPEEVQKNGLAAHLQHTRYFGRNPAKFLEGALRQFQLQ